MMKASHGTAAILTAAFLLGGCHARSESSADAGEGRSAATAIRAAYGGSAVEAGAGKAAMPAGLPLYPGAQIGTDTLIASGGKAGVIVFRSSDAPDAVADFYKNAASQAGYVIAGEMKAGDAQLLSGKKADGTSFHLTVNRESGVTEATMLAGTEG